MPSDQAMEKSDLLLKLGAVVDRVPTSPNRGTSTLRQQSSKSLETLTASSHTSPDKTII